MKIMEATEGTALYRWMPLPWGIHADEKSGMSRLKSERA